MRRVRCGAVLLPSRLLPSSSAASVWRRFLPPRVRCRALTFHTSPSCSARLPRRTILFSFLRPQHQRATLASAILLPSVCCRLPCVLAACICVRARAPRIFLHPHPPFRVHSPCFLHPDGARSLPPVPSRVPGGPCRKLCCVLPWACHCHSAPLFLSPFVRYIVWSADAYLRTVCERRTPRHPTSGCACHCAAFVSVHYCLSRLNMYGKRREAEGGARRRTERDENTRKSEARACAAAPSRTRSRDASRSRDATRAADPRREKV